MLNAVAKMIGDHNVTRPDVEQLIGEAGNFNDHLIECKIIACEEIRVVGKDRYKVENTLKSDITDRVKFIRRKFGGQSDEKLYGCMLGFSNYHDCIQISEDARRYNFFSGPGYKNTPEYYQVLHDWLDPEEIGEDEVSANVAQMFGFFMNFDISDFNITTPTVSYTHLTLPTTPYV